VNFGRSGEGWGRKSEGRAGKEGDDVDGIDEEGKGADGDE